MRKSFTTAAWLASCALIAGAAVLHCTSSATAAPAPQSSVQPTTGELVRVLTIGGRRVRISVGTWLDLMPPTEGSTPLAASVSLATVHGRDLPQGLVAERVLLRRVGEVPDGERRTWNPALIPVTNIRFDPTSALYHAGGGPAWEGGELCECIVRLNHNGRIVRVNMGTLNIAEAF